MRSLKYVVYLLTITIISSALVLQSRKIDTEKRRKRGLAEGICSNSIVPRCIHEYLESKVLQRESAGLKDSLVVQEVSSVRLLSSIGLTHEQERE